MIWKARNEQIFQGKERNISAQHVAQLAKLHTLAIINYTKIQKKKQRMSKALEFIQFHIHRNSI
jgi:hypothetical protein